jgi:hypothetical protein
VLNSLSNPSAQGITYTFVLTNGTAGSADYTTNTLCVYAGCNWNVSVPTTAD